MALAMAFDKFIMSYVSYPFESESTSYRLCFVDDLPMDVVDTATLSICSSRLLVPANVLDPIYESTRELVHAVASQWVGVNLVPRTFQDSWIIVGGSYFMTDLFMQSLWGKNEHRFRMKQASDRVHELDVKRPSIYELGDLVGLDPSDMEFFKLKSSMVFWILHHRLVKASGRNGIDRIFNRALLDARNEKMPEGIDTERLLRILTKTGHMKTDGPKFLQQWVYSSGCPTFMVTQRFNKKKLVVEMLLSQVSPTEQFTVDQLSPDSFLREAKEYENSIHPTRERHIFTGPMTIRIHEADGTPYEHIVDIKDVVTKFDIPYNTKYKRLKRNRRQKERAAAAAGLDISGEPEDDVLVYCLGDTLQSEEEVRDWDLADWTKEEEERMNQESFEWIRIDKDSEWITRITFNQPHYMFVSQLQQDNDVVAQVESIQYLLTQQPHKMVSTILVQTLMDVRYFYGVRVMAAAALARCATANLNWIGLTHLEKAFQKLFCYEGSEVLKPNDFSDWRNYRVQLAIAEAMAKVRGADGKAPDRVKRFFLDKLKFNDNSENEVSRFLILISIADDYSIPMPFTWLPCYLV
jgi:transcription initiation factor TFIID subunit 2